MSSIVQRRLIGLSVLVTTTVFVCGFAAVAGRKERSRAIQWTNEERSMLRSLSLTSLEPLAPDPSNRYANDARAAVFG